MICPVGSLKRGAKPRITLTSLTGKLSLIELLLYLLKRSSQDMDGSARVRAESFLHRDPVATRPTPVDFHTGARPAVGPFDPAAVAERRAIHEQILAINRRLENLKGSLSDLTVRLGASAAVTLPPTESA